MKRKELEEKISAVLNNLEEVLKKQEHLESPLKVASLVSEVTLYQDYMSEAEQEFLSAAIAATDEKIQWQTPVKQEKLATEPIPECLQDVPRKGRKSYFSNFEKKRRQKKRNIKVQQSK